MFRLFRLFGTDVFVNYSVVVLVLLASMLAGKQVTYHLPGTSILAEAAFSVAFSLLLLFSILAHEFGHVLTGRLFGVNCNTVVLHMFGGLAALIGSPRTSKAEFWIAVAGPATSVALALLSAVCGILYVFLTGSVDLVALLFVLLQTVNFALAIFNMIPCFPMDGGRVFRAAVWKFTGNYIKSTKVAVFVGKLLGGVAIGCAVMMALGFYIPFFGVGVVSGIWLAVLASIIMWMGEQELRQARMRRLL